MNDLSTPLNEKELNQLSDFLLDRVDEKHEDDPDFDCGVIDLGELDGFFTAIVSGPNVVPPSVWIPFVWGDEEPEWESADQLQAITTLLIRHMNSIAAALAAEPDSFEPLFAEQCVEDETHEIMDDWCFGYMMGVWLDEEAWALTDPTVHGLLAPIELHGTEEGWKALETMAPAEAVHTRDGIPQAVRDIYAYWLAWRAQQPPSQPRRRTSPRVGRNEPCPCGSGRKYKFCCLQ